MVAAVVDDAVDRHAANPALAPLFQGQDLPQLKALGVRIVSAATGGPDPGLAPGKPSHNAGMGFSPAQLQAIVGDVTDALREQGVGAVEVGEVVQLIHARRASAPGR